MKNKTEECVVLLVGAGIMSATLLKHLQPSWSIKIVERLDSNGLESSWGLNNAGTGHSGFCELNYDLNKAIETCEAFEKSKQFWSYLVRHSHIKSDFIHSVPHMSFVTGRDNVEQLRQRWRNMTKSCLFEDMEFSDDFKTISQWAPLLMKGRDPKVPIAATRMKRGTDVDFGQLTNNLFEHLGKLGRVNMCYNEEVVGLKKSKEDDSWHVISKNAKTHQQTLTKAHFVFIGAGGAALNLLEKSGIPEGKGYGGFPVSGQWLICDKPEIAEQHHAKVYGKPEIGTPPMSVPHLDTRIINGKKVLLFGPYAGFSTKFLKNGHWTDFFKSLRFSNVFTILSAGLKNLGLSKYLVKEVTKTKDGRFKTLLTYYPSANINDWKPAIAGQRVQVIKKDKGIPTIEFGTEVIISEDGSLAALLGASPGASTSVKIMMDVIQKCFIDKQKYPYFDWDKMEAMIPSGMFSAPLHKDEEFFKEVEKITSSALSLNE